MTTNNPYSIASERIRRAPYQAMAAILVMTMTLFLACAFFLIAAGSQAVLKYFESQPQVNAFFKDDLVPSPQQIELIRANLEATNLTSTIKYVSKEEALKIYKDLNKSDPLLLEAVTEKMLPASIEVSTTKPEDLKTIAELLKKQEGINDVEFAEDVIASLSNWTKSVRIVGTALVGSHIFITFLVIVLIIGLKVSAKRDEIHTMQLVGATSGYIIGPFVSEGIIYGLTGGFIAWGTAYIILLYSTGFLVSFLGSIPILPIPIEFMAAVLGGMLTLGVLIGGLGGWLAVQRFLKA